VRADEYLGRVDAALSDLPWSVRRDLMVELKGHLEELPPDEASRLGTPEEYAAELRAAAGLERRRGVIAFLRARRPRNVVLTAVALAAIGLAIGAIAWINSYQPLAPGGGSQYPPGAKPAVGSDSEEVEFQQGKPFEIGVSIVNNGRFTVRVLGTEPQPYLPWSARLYSSGPLANDGGFPRVHRRFRPFDLAPGQAAFLVLRGTYDATCKERPGTQSFWTVGGFAVRYRFLWRTGVSQIDLAPPVQIDGPKGMSCDGAEISVG
jgi:hypothetical protein